MASGKTHVVIGCGVGLCVYGFYKYQKKEDWTVKHASYAMSTTGKDIT